MVEEFAPDLGAIDEAFMVLRSQHFVVDRELQMQTHREMIKPDIIWNAEQGLAQTPSRIAWAERERAAFFRRFAEMFETYDIFVSPSAATPAFDVNLRHPEYVGGKKLDRLHGRFHSERGGDDDELSRGGGAVRVRSVRPADRIAGDGADPAGSACDGCGVGIRAAHRSRQVAADRPASRDCATMISAMGFAALYPTYAVRQIVGWVERGDTHHAIAYIE